MPKKVIQPRENEGEVYRFRIDAYTPETIPMQRLAEYMQQLSLLLGESAHVHFQRVETGSTILVHQIESAAISKVRSRIANIKRGEGPTEPLRAYKAINKMLRDDNAVGQWSPKTGAVILPFPGREEAREEFPSVRQRGALDGIVTGVKGKDESIHITLDMDGVQVAGCQTNKVIAKQLGARMFEAVRLFGKGKWKRSDEGVWILEEFKIDAFEPLDDAPLSSVMADLRSIPTEWGDSAIAELDQIRHGPRGNPNGGH